MQKPDSCDLIMLTGLSKNPKDIFNSCSQICIFYLANNQRRMHANVNQNWQIGRNEIIFADNWTWLDVIGVLFSNLAEFVLLHIHLQDPLFKLRRHIKLAEFNDNSSLLATSIIPLELQL